MNQFTVGDASLATEPAKYGLRDLGFDQARSFQNRVVEWVHDGNTPVSVVRAPTGAGKTATFHELISVHQPTLLVYPTNALLRQQHERFVNAEVDAAVLNGETLEGYAHRRTENLLGFLDTYENDYDVILTNPDILQATIQDMYSGDHAMRFFDNFNAIVYDEFHFYDPLAASGLLLQIKIISERQVDPKIILASATPNEDFVEFVRTQLQLDVQNIEAEYVENGDRFRQRVEVVRHEERRIVEVRDAVAQLLHEEINTTDDHDEPRVVLAFNSAKDSNDFHDYLADEYETVFKHTEKDNGFDTNDDLVDLDDETFYILNTTSKGEVGLDYDVETLIMENPTRPSAFLQRFGRAGRASEATVHIYGLGQGPWGTDVDFQTFTKQVYDGLQEERMAPKALGDLMGLRGAYGIEVREDGYGWFNPEIFEDLASNNDQYGRWRNFIEDVNDELDAIDGLGGKPYDAEVNKLLKFTKECFEVFRGLRGRSLSAQIEYPRGDRLGLTTYDLGRTLRGYEIDCVREGTVLRVKPSDENSLSLVTARLPAYETEPTRYDEPTGKIEKTLQDKIRPKIDHMSRKDDFGVSTELLHRFFDVVRITDAIVPRRLTTATYEIDVGDEGSGPPTIEVHRRQI
ncbi:type I-D CRISPR-associated helicase Cas3' [Haladaptatus cibarius]|uniref:type I-D CRISPR-associated helicase Cas3' n=1 Tax=Haladaptatus cibarius TaxID=453847 RepID=UPI0006788CE4|nr:type I-D CRISPR-associated helicase Cas3' [Haladaptatus cibarius]